MPDESLKAALLDLYTKVDILNAALSKYKDQFDDLGSGPLEEMGITVKVKMAKAILKLQELVGD